MDNVVRVCAIVTGSLAGLCGLVNLSWWADTGFAAYSGYAVMITACGIGFLGWFVMFGMLLMRASQSKLRSRTDFVITAAPVVARVWRKPARLLLLVALAIIVATAVAGARAGEAVTGQWNIDDPYGWHHCHWPLTADHDTQHMCVSHERYLAVDHANNRLFVAGGIGALALECVVFTTLAGASRASRRPLGEPLTAGSSAA